MTKLLTFRLLLIFSLLNILLFTASDCEGTEEEEVNTHIGFFSPAEDSHQGISRNGNTRSVDIRLIRNDNEQTITLGISEIPDGLAYSFQNEILYGPDENETTLNISNLLSLNEDIITIKIYAQAPGQTVHRTFNISRQHFTLMFSADTVYIEQGFTDTIDISYNPINFFDCDVSAFLGFNLQLIDAQYISQNSSTITANEPARLWLKGLTPGTHTVEVFGETRSFDCYFIEKDTARFFVKVTSPSLWTDVTFNPPPPILYDIDGDYAVGENGTILRTSDEGLTWEYLSSGTSSSLKAVLVDGGSIYVAGDNGTVLQSGDGVNWQNISVLGSLIIEDIHRVGNHLWVVGSDGFNAVAFRSVDGGNTWVKSNTPANQNFYPTFFGVSFSDTSNGILVGNLNSKIFRTTDAGESWEIISIPVVQLEHISGSVACGVSGTIIRTTNGGASWQTLNSGGFGNLTSFEGVIYVGYNSYILRQESGNYIAEETGIPGFQTNLFGVTLNGTYIAVGGNSVSGGKIIKRQPLN